MFVASSGAFSTTSGFVIRKSSVLSGGPVVVTAFRGLITGGDGPDSPRGVDNYDPSSNEGYIIGPSDAAFGRLILRRVGTPGGTPTISGNIAITVNSTSLPIPVDHLGNTGGNNGRLDALDDRLFAAHIRNGRLWTAHNIAVTSAGVAASTSNSQRRDGVRWYELNGIRSADNGGTPVVVQSGTIFDTANTLSTSRQYWIPSVMVSGQGHAALGFSTAGTPFHADAATVGRLAGDTLGTVQTVTNYTASTTAYNPPSDPSGTSGRRWGDYSFTSLDPNDDMTMWTIQEFCDSANSYGVRVVRLFAPPPATPAGCSPSSLTQGVSNVNVILTGTSASGSGFFDPGPGFPNHISAVINGGSVTVNSVTYSNPTIVTLNVTVATDAPVGARTATVTNPDGQGATSGTGTLTIVTGVTNSLPVINAASISPGSPTTTNELLAAVTSASDVDGDPITFAYQWQESTDNSIFTNLLGQTASNLSAAVTIAGDYYRVTITPNDGQTNGAPFTTASVLVPVDADGNGINDDWEVQYFGHIGVNPNADPDGDGFSNLQEFLAGTDPTNSASVFRITSIVSTGDDVLIDWMTGIGRTNALQASAGTVDGSYNTNDFADIFTVTNTTGPLTNYLDVGAATNIPSRFYRVRLVP
jgi:hypothetical protein